MPHRRIPVSVSLRFAIFERDEFTCQYCGATAPDAQLVVDHVMPVARGGGSDPDNLVASCARCNQGKSDRVVYPPSWLPVPQLVRYREIAISYTQDIQMHVWDTHGMGYAPHTQLLVSLLYRFRSSDVETAVYAVADDYRRRGVLPNSSGYRYIAALLRHLRQLRQVRSARAAQSRGRTE